jgi:hypothetical protein
MKNNFPLGRRAWIRGLLALDRRRIYPRPQQFSRAVDAGVIFRMLPYTEIVMGTTIAGDRQNAPAIVKKAK